jgi:hypothetical protein
MGPTAPAVGALASGPKGVRTCRPQRAGSSCCGDVGPRPAESADTPSAGPRRVRTRRPQSRVERHPSPGRNPTPHRGSHRPHPGVTGGRPRCRGHPHGADGSCCGGVGLRPEGSADMPSAEGRQFLLWGRWPPARGKCGHAVRRAEEGADTPSAGPRRVWARRARRRVERRPPPWEGFRCPGGSTGGRVVPGGGRCGPGGGSPRRPGAARAGRGRAGCPGPGRRSRGA